MPDCASSNNGLQIDMWACPSLCETLCVQSPEIQQAMSYGRLKLHAEPFCLLWLALFAQDLLLSALLASLTACPLGACRACWEVTPRRQGGATAPRLGTPAA